MVIVNHDQQGIYFLSLGQGETVDRIEHYADEGATQLEEGVKKTAKAARQKKYCTILKIFLWLFLATFVVIVGLTVYTGRL